MAHPGHVAENGRRETSTSFALDGGRRDGRPSYATGFVYQPVGMLGGAGIAQSAYSRCSDAVSTTSMTLAEVAQLPIAVRVLIVDDCTLHRENLAAVLAAHTYSPPAVSWDPASLAAAFAEAVPDVVLVNMGTRDGITLLHQVRDACPQAKVIVVGIREDDESLIVACAEAGVAGYHLRSDPFDALLELMPKVASGQSTCPPRVSAVLLKRLSALAAQRRSEPEELVLTARETQIVQLLELGYSNRDIAEELCIALHTVKNHVHSVLTKLGVSTRAEAAVYSRSIRCPGAKT